MCHHKVLRSGPPPLLSLSLGAKPVLAMAVAQYYSVWKYPGSEKRAKWIYVEASVHIGIVYLPLLTTQIASRAFFDTCKSSRILSSFALRLSVCVQASIHGAGLSLLAWRRWCLVVASTRLGSICHVPTTCTTTLV